MGYPIRDVPMTAREVVATIRGSQNLRLTVMGKLTTFQQSRNFTGRKLTEAEEDSLMDEMAFAIECGVRAARGEL